MKKSQGLLPLAFFFDNRDNRDESRGIGIIGIIPRIEIISRIWGIGIIPGCGIIPEGEGLFFQDFLVAFFEVGGIEIKRADDVLI